MTERKHSLIAGVLTLVLLSVALAACGGSSSKHTTGAAAAVGTPSGTVNVASTGLGKILVDSRGLTLYLFEADKGATSACSGACAAAWPPLVTSGKPTAGGGIDASLLGTTKRSDGTMQLTYSGHPLYRFASDTKPGDTTGQGVNGFGALWYVLSAAGDPITNQQASSGAGSGGSANPYSTSTLHRTVCPIRPRQREQSPHDQPADSRPDCRPSHHAGEYGPDPRSITSRRSSRRSGRWTQLFC